VLRKLTLFCVCWQGIGRKVMTKYGWHEGQSLGSSVQGIVDALDAEGGQKPSDRRGFGYVLCNDEFFGDVVYIVLS